jgi:hypothetical protein
LITDRFAHWDRARASGIGRELGCRPALTATAATLRQRCDRAIRRIPFANRLIRLRFNLAHQSHEGLFVMNKQSSNRLVTIANRQRKLIIRDLFFAAFVVMAAAIGVTSVGSAIAGATTHQVADR